MRQALYESLGSYSDPIVRRTRGWLAVLAARKVLPIFQRYCPLEELPAQLIQTSADLIELKVSAIEAADVEDHGYHALGHSLGTDAVSDRYFENAHLAALAAYKSLLETSGLEDPFSNAELHVKGTGSFASLHSFAGPGKSPEEGWISAVDWNDHDWGLTAQGDTAGTAAIAFSCSEDATDCDPVRLQEFWTWWLTEAVALAWKQASDIGD